MILHKQQKLNILLVLHNQEKDLYKWKNYNGSKSFLFVNATKIYRFKAKDSENKNYTLCLGNISKVFRISNMKKTGLKESVKFFPVDCNPINTNETKSFYIFLVFLAIRIALLVAVSIYSYLIKYKVKQKHLLPFHVTNKKLKRFLS